MQFSIFMPTNKHIPIVLFTVTVAKQHSEMTLKLDGVVTFLIPGYHPMFSSIFSWRNRFEC